MRHFKNIIAVIAALIIFTAYLSFAGTAADDTGAHDLYKKAQQLQSDKKEGDSIDIYKEIIEKFPGSNYAVTSVQRIQYYYNRFGKKWLGENYFNSVVKRDDVPETLRGSARMAIAYLKGMHLYSSTHGTFKPREKASVSINGHKIDTLDIKIYKVERDYIVNNIGRVRNILNLDDVKRSLVQEFTASTDMNNDYFYKNIEFTLQDPGFYIFEGRSEYLMTKTVLVVTNNILVIKSDDKNSLVWLADRTTGKPVQKAGVFIPLNDGSITKGVTDGSGIFVAPLDLKRNNSSMVSAVSGDDISVSDAYFYGYYANAMVYVYTDRPVYRPSQKVNFKGVIREVAEGEYNLPKNSKADIIVRDARYNEVKKFSATLTDFGTFSGDYDIPDEPPLGRYQLDVIYAGHTYYGNFTVEEYKKPEYFITIDTEKSNYIVGDKVKVDINVNYYFGNAVPDAEVAWEAYERRYYSPWWRSYRYSWYFSQKESEYYYGYGRGSFVTRGSAKTDADGSASFEFDTKHNDYDSTYTIVVKVTDKSRKVVENETAVMVTKGEFRMDVTTDKYSYKKDETVFVKVNTVDYTGMPVSKAVEVEVIKTVWKDRKQSDSGLYMKKVIETSSAGSAELDFKVDETGRYEIILTATDSRGTKITYSRSVYVYEYGGYYYYDSAKGVEITPDKDMYNPGETANLFITTQYPDCYALVTVEQKKLHYYKMVKFEGNSGVVPVELTDAYKPNVTVVVSIVSNNNFLTQQQTLIILPEDKFLTIKIEPDKDKYKPGETATFVVKTTDYKGNPVSAEISFALVDESIFALMSEQSKNIQEFYYGLQQNWVQTRTSFNFYFYGHTGGAMEPEKPAMSAPAEGKVMALEESDNMALDSVGGAKKEKGRFREDMKKDAEEALVEASVREKFEDTAYYRAVITTDETGTAGFEVPLPDNLTTWRASVKGVTKDTKVGQATGSIIVTKNLLVRLEMPRFFTKRDKGTVTGIIHNYLGEAKKVKVTLKVEPDALSPLELKSAGELWIDVGANEEKRIDWPVDVVRVGEADVTLIAQTNEESDAMKLKIPVLPHGIMQYAGDAGVVENERTVALTIPKDSLNDAARLRLVFSPSVANVVTESLEYLIGYPYGCVEQTMSRFLPNVLVSKTLQNLGIELPDTMGNLPDMVAKGLERLYNFQHGDGGWGWWESDDTHPFMTAYVIYGLTEAKNADYDISQDAFKRGLHSLANQTRGKMKEDSIESVNTIAYMVYAITNVGMVEKRFLDYLYDNKGKLNNYSLALLAESLNKAKENEKAAVVAKKLLDNVEDSGAFAYFESKAYKHHGWYDSDTEATAYALKALVKVDPKNVIIPKLVLWLAKSRVGIRWYNTKDTAAAVMALSEYLAISDELDPDYSFSVKVNGRDIGRYSVTKQNMFTLDGDIAVDNALLKEGENNIEIAKKGKGTLYYSAFLKYYSNEEHIDDSSSGIKVKKTIYKKVHGGWDELKGDLKTGDEIKVVIDVDGGEGYEYVIIEDPKPAGCDEVIRSYESSASTRHYWWSNIDHRDEKVAVFITRMWSSEYKFEYELTAQTPGEFHVMPARAYMMYKDEIGGNSDEFTIKISD